MLNAQRRHRLPCKKSEWDAGYTKCSCPIVIRGVLAGKPVSVSTAKYLPKAKRRNFEAARDLAIVWEKVGAIVSAVPATTAELAPIPTPALPTIEKAVASYYGQAKAIENAEDTLYKKRNVFLTGKQSLTAFAASQGIRFVQEISIDFLRDWRSTWNVAALSRHKRQCQVIGFLWFCERAGWLPRNYASDMTTALGKIKVTATETQPFEQTEYKAVVDATYIYSDRPSIDKHNSSTLGGQRIRALTELMRWTGLRIRDAVTLERDRVGVDTDTGITSIRLRQRKTGEWVYCPIPPHVAELLSTVPPGPKQMAGGRYFFWTGHGLPKTVVSNWERSYAKLFKLANLKDSDGNVKRAFPHMFRDTYAVEGLLSGMLLEEVSKILGHKSIKTTEESYMPWVRARQSGLNTSVVNSWIAQGIVAKTGLHVVRRKVG